MTAPHMFSIKMPLKPFLGIRTKGKGVKSFFHQKYIQEQERKWSDGNTGSDTGRKRGGQDKQP